MVRTLNRKHLTAKQLDKVIEVRRTQLIKSIKDLVDEVLADINDHGIIVNSALMYEIDKELKEIS